MHDGILGIAGREQNLERDAALVEFLRELTAVHPALHDHVGEQQIEFGTTFDERERLGGVRRRQRRVAEALQLRNHVSAHKSIVLDHQDRFAAAGDRRRRLLRRRVSFLVGAREIKLDGRSVALFAVELDVAARLLDEAVDHAQSQSGAFAHFLG